MLNKAGEQKHVWFLDVAKTPSGTFVNVAETIVGMQKNGWLIKLGLEPSCFQATACDFHIALTLNAVPSHCCENKGLKMVRLEISPLQLQQWSKGQVLSRSTPSLWVLVNDLKKCSWYKIEFCIKPTRNPRGAAWMNCLTLCKRF